MTDVSGFVGQLAVTNANNGPVTFATDGGSGASSPVSVSASGEIRAGTLPQGTYTVGGTDSDAAGDTGTWSFTLTVPSCGQITQSVGHAPAVGTVVNFGQRISTGRDGGAVITFPDNSTVALNENTEFICDQFLNGGDTSTWSLLKGLFVYVSGLIGKQDHDQLNIETQSAGGCCGIRGCVGMAAVLRGGKLLLHVIEGSGFVRFAGRPEFDFPAGEGVLIAGDRYQETLHLPARRRFAYSSARSAAVDHRREGDRQGTPGPAPAVQAQRDRSGQALRSPRQAHGCLGRAPSEEGHEQVAGTQGIAERLICRRLRRCPPGIHVDRDGGAGGSVADERGERLTRLRPDYPRSSEAAARPA